MSSSEAGDVHHPAVGRFRLHGGKLEEFKRLSVQAMETARAKDTGTLQYEIYGPSLYALPVKVNTVDAT